MENENDDEMINEVFNNPNNIQKIDIHLHEVLNSVCKIIYNNKYGTGFLIKIFKDDKELYCLMTNEHVVNKQMIDSKKIIDVKYNFEKNG